LQSLAGTINTRVIRLTNLAPNKVTRKDVPHSRAMVAEKLQTDNKKPRFQVGNKFHDKEFFQQKLKEIFTINAILTLNPPTNVFGR